MSKHIIQLRDNKFSIGHVGENQANTFLFNIEEWLKIFAEGEPILLIQRPDDAAPYPVDVKLINSCVYWLVSSLDTEKAGTGKAQLIYKINEQIVKSKVYTIVIEESLGKEEKPPDPTPSWIDKIIDIGVRVEEAIKHAPQIIDGNWHIWDPTVNDYIDTGVSATEPGPIGPTGPIGPIGPVGPIGPPGLGLPAGGAKGQILSKNSEEDYDVNWGDLNVDKNFIYEQLVPSDFWIIEHDLDKYPTVDVIDSGGSLVVGDVDYLDKNHLTITFRNGFSGKAYLN